MTPDISRLQEIMRFALQLGWVKPKWNSDYPLMQLSEVEKCMVAMTNDFEFERLKKWAIEAGLK